jgi:hypothetical protein
MNNHMLDKLVEWAQGFQEGRRQLCGYPTGPMTSNLGIDLDITLKVRQTAEKMGV